MIESQFKYEFVAVAPPEGWRHLRNDLTSGGMTSLWTSAPPDEPWYEHKWRWFLMHKVEYQREVSEWERVQ